MSITFPGETGSAIRTDAPDADTLGANSEYH